jgi:hypothetical protein
VPKALVDNAKFHERTKHIRIRYHKIRELQADGTVRVEWIPREENPADMGTKALGRPLLEKWRGVVGLRNLE